MKNQEQREVRTREQKEALANLLKQKLYLKQENKLKSFQPNKGAQAAFFKSHAKVRMLCGGNGIGKTTAIVIELLYTHLKQHPDPKRDLDKTNHSWVVIPGYDKVEDYWREIQRWCPLSKLPDTDKMGTSVIRRLRWKNGNTTTFYSMDQEPLKLEGTNFDALFLDEPPPRNLYIAAYRGLRNNPNYFICFACTPISEPWLYTDIYLPGVSGRDKNIEVFQGSTYENEYLSKEFIEDFKSRLTDDEVKVRIYGEFAALQGRVFKEFSRVRHVIPDQAWPEDWPVWCGIDPHTRKPNTAVWVGVTPEDNYVVLKEIQVEGIQELADAIISVEKRYNFRVIQRRIDNSGSALDWSRNSAVECLSRPPNNIRVSPMKNREKSLEDGIHRISQLLKGERIKKDEDRFLPRLKFFQSCQQLIEDMELYCWHDSRHPEKSGVMERPRKVHDDMIDPLRYVLISKPTFHGLLEPVSYVEFEGKHSQAKDLTSQLKHLFTRGTH